MKVDQAQRILSHLAARKDEMLDLLSQSAKIESPSTVPASQDAVFQLFQSYLQDVGFRCRRVSGRSTGGQLLAVPNGFPKSTPKQLLLGHVDTVWPQGTLASMPVESRNGCLFGPGVYDMKGGLVQGVFALAALRELGIQPTVTPIFYINSDEEIGSHESASHIRLLARIADRALIVEPSLGPFGQLKTSRKGVGHFRITVTGTASHAGLNPEQGVSAILELSHVVQILFALNDPARGITVNVGKIDGGVRANVVAPQSRAEVDVRVRTQQDADMIERVIHSIEPTVPGTSLKIEGRIRRPPLERTPRNLKLWQRALELGQSLGIELEEGAAGGGSDGNWTSLFTSTLDGLGAVGDGAHAAHEHVVEDRMPERAALLACLLLGEPIGKNQTP